MKSIQRAITALALTALSAGAQAAPSNPGCGPGDERLCRSAADAICGCQSSSTRGSRCEIRQNGGFCIFSCENRYVSEIPMTTLYRYRMLTCEDPAQTIWDRNADDGLQQLIVNHGNGWYSAGRRP